MKISHLMTALLVSIVVVLGGNLLFGSHSGENYDALAAHRERLARNVAELEARHTKLQAQVELLRRSGDAVQVEARRLHYYAPDEVVVRVEGTPPRANQQSPGRIILGAPANPDNRSALRLAGIIAGVAVFVALVIGSRSDSRGQAT